MVEKIISMSTLLIGQHHSFTSFIILINTIEHIPLLKPNLYYCFYAGLTGSSLEVSYRIFPVDSYVTESYWEISGVSLPSIIRAEVILQAII